MITDTKVLIHSLSNGPIILNHLLELIPSHLIKEKRKAGCWTIHEQVCHLIDAQSILRNRFEIFADNESPHISAHEPTEEQGPDYYLAMDMEKMVSEFPAIRASMVEMLSSYPESYWRKTGTHDAFIPYSSRQLLIHTLNVDHTHFFSIEQLGFTRKGQEANILTVL